MYVVKLALIVCAFSVLVGESEGGPKWRKFVYFLKKLLYIIGLFKTPPVEIDKKLPEAMNKNEFHQLLNDAFDKEKHPSVKMAVVDWYGIWCKPCEATSKMLEKLAASRPDIVFFKVNVGQNDDLSTKYEVDSTPHLTFFKGDKDSDGGWAASAFLIAPKEQAILDKINELENEPASTTTPGASGADKTRSATDQSASKGAEGSGAGTGTEKQTATTSISPGQGNSPTPSTPNQQTRNLDPQVAGGQNDGAAGSGAGTGTGVGAGQQPTNASPPPTTNQQQSNPDPQAGGQNGGAAGTGSGAGTGTGVGAGQQPTKASPPPTTNQQQSNPDPQAGGQSGGAAGPGSGAGSGQQTATPAQGNPQTPPTTNQQQSNPDPQAGGQNGGSAGPGSATP